jgi:hypothetical protein
MRLDQAHPMNKGVLRHASDPARLRYSAEPLATPDRHPDPYMDAGSHPEIVEHLWGILGSSLPADCRELVYGTPALIHPTEGIVLALGYGTKYAIRVPKGLLQSALEAGCTTEQEWTGGGRTRIEKELGPGWVFGAWVAEEKQFLALAYEECEAAT